jgi:hypothetical protein
MVANLVFGSMYKIKKKIIAITTHPKLYKWQ